MASSGEEVISNFEKTGSAGSGALGSVKQSATQATEAVGTVKTAASETTDKLENMGESGSASIATLKQAIAAAGLAKLLKEVWGAVSDMANEFSRAESIVAKSTGAIGVELDRLSGQVTKVYATVPDSIETVATVLSTLNTATGVTGNALEELTDITLKYARVNNEDAGVSAQSLGRLMNALDLDASGLGKTMDQLTRASQMSGLGVNQRKISVPSASNKVTMI
jgi:phage-related minor tail protein